MKFPLYLHLAYDGMRKNRRLYLPYLLTCAGMVTMFYILASLAVSPLLQEMRCGENTAMILSLGQGVVGVFALLFLFYTNAFLLRRRKKEFGLYSILGMGKGGLLRILSLETILTFLFSLGLGLLCGIAFSKLAELGLVNLVHSDVDYLFRLSGSALLRTLELFAVVFLLLFLNALRQIHCSDPITLLQSEQLGEKPPRSNYFLTIPGLLLLGTAYYLAVTIERPIEALTWFFFAVIMVILATYLLFIAGSVTMCRLLQKNKSFYYRKQHFISLSSMLYRMKRNGASLASICILSTMVLVMISSSASLYFGIDNMISRKPREMNLTISISGNEEESFSAATISSLKKGIDTKLNSLGVQPEQQQYYRKIVLYGIFQDGKFYHHMEALEKGLISNSDECIAVCLLSLADYNACAGRQETLRSDQVLVYPQDCQWDGTSLCFSSSPQWQVKSVLSEFFPYLSSLGSSGPTLFVILPELEMFSPYLQYMFSYSLNWVYSFDLNEDCPLSSAQLQDQLQSWGMSVRDGSPNIAQFSVDSRSVSLAEVYSIYGGLFFIGLVLSLSFILATALMLYYKQTAEGYEDQSRFAIMQKVGMSRKDIRSSINSQILMVFFIPLLAAVMHLCFAMPLIWKILQLFGLQHLSVVLAITAGCVALFALLYCLMYRLTSNAYFSIVSNGSAHEA